MTSAPGADSGRGGIGRLVPPAPSLSRQGGRRPSAKKGSTRPACRTLCGSPQGHHSAIRLQHVGCHVEVNRRELGVDHAARSPAAATNGDDAATPRRRFRAQPSSGLPGRSSSNSQRRHPSSGLAVASSRSAGSGQRRARLQCSYYAATMPPAGHVGLCDGDGSCHVTISGT